MDKKQKEAHVLALYEKGKTYREITKEAGVSPNTIKAIVNKAGDQMTSISSRAFELYVKQKTPLEVAIALNLEAEKAIQYHQQYFILLGCTEFTRVYPQIKDNPWLYVNLARLIQNARMVHCWQNNPLYKFIVSQYLMRDHDIIDFIVVQTKGLPSNVY
jgi:lambda repressor-like predicted transcriptional regulator